MVEMNWGATDVSEANDEGCYQTHSDNNHMYSVMLAQ